MGDLHFQFTSDYFHAVSLWQAKNIYNGRMSVPYCHILIRHGLSMLSLCYFCEIQYT